MHINQIEAPVVLSQCGRVNILAGSNDIGKTKTLEAISLKVKKEGEPCFLLSNPSWVIDFFPANQEKIIVFLRKNVMPSLTDIMPGYPTLVEGDEYKPYTSCSSGVRRMLSIAGSVASKQHHNGIVLIDDFDVFIHIRNFTPFVELIHDLAVTNNVQLFLSTHSAEMIHTWVADQTRWKDVVGYGFCHRDGILQALRFDGERLCLLHESFGFDMRCVDL